MINEFYVCDAIVISGDDGYRLLGVNNFDPKTMTEIKNFSRMDMLINYCASNKIHIVDFR